MANMKFTDKNGLNGYTFVRNPRFPLDILDDERNAVSRINRAGNKRNYVQAVKQVITLNFPFVDVTQLTNLKYFKNLNDSFRWYTDSALPGYLDVTMQNEWRQRLFSPTLYSLVMVVEEI